MAVDTRELRQTRAKLVTDTRALMDAADKRGEEMTPEETEAYEKMDAQIDALGKRIEREERQNEREKELAKADLEREDRKKESTTLRNSARYEVGKQLFYTEQELEHRTTYALQGWLRAMRPDAKLDAEHIEAAKFFGIDFSSRDIELPIAKNYRKMRNEFRAMSLQVGSGGYTVPEGFVQNLEQALLQFGGVRQVADVIRTTGGNDLPWPTMNDTTNKGAIIAEAYTFGTSVDPTFGAVVLKAYKYSSKPIICSNELLMDSAFDLGAMIGNWLGTRIGRIQNDHFTSGAGGGNLPTGLTVASTRGVHLASRTAMVADEVISFEHSIDPAYRPQSRWMMHDSILAYVRTLKNVVDGRYLWEPGLANGVPDRLLGYQYIINQSMESALAQSNIVMLFGDFAKYKIRDVASIRLVRLDELFAQTDQVGFVAFLRSDGNLLDAGTKPVKFMQCQTT